MLPFSDKVAVSISRAANGALVCHGRCRGESLVSFYKDNIQVLLPQIVTSVVFVAGENKTPFDKLQENYCARSELIISDRRWTVCGHVI